ncbi:hypothetical protein CONLIGDRAFT_651771 [Coniochaeta ligniaria NRRL 30616]|uniref:PHD-type domain-containing protein n=1 Tax=Coniochaeta ligniaria NRRL 30616 TaxID=1408157 RepID=A0A1J7JYQ7_9PEZI|nr:hypothetical protein CONLIGDRAFT_651771 [Coniochaeta ligniaria NRRL 30616]
MSGDQQAPRQDNTAFPPTSRLTGREHVCFGDTNAQPPTPKQTPTSSIFSSPFFETPRDSNGRFDEVSGGWTPRFAEEYSVFNATPGNLRGTNGPFGDFGSLTPYIQQQPQPASQKRPLTAEGIAAEIATHVNHFSPTPNLPLPPVQPSQRLQSSPGQAASEFSQPTEKGCDQQSSSQERSGKKRRRDTIEEESQEEEQGQTVTPPPSARKSQRKLAPKLDLNAMHNDQGYSQQDFINGTGQQQHNMGTYVTTPSDMFGYPLSAGPMSAPAAGQAFGNQRAFWDTDPSMAGMDINYSGTAGANVFHQQTTAHHGTMESLEWARANQMFQQAGGIPQQNQENMQGPPNGERASKAVMPPLETGSDGQSMYTDTYSTQMDNSPFGIMGNAGGVNPGLLFSRPPSSSLTSEAFTQAALGPSASAPPVQAQQHAPPPPPAQSRAAATKQRGELRRSMSSKELGPTGRTDRSFATSPTKPSARPGLSRSFSESRGKKPVVRTSLPPLAPAPRPQTGIASNRPVVSQAVRPSGRTSPLKSDHHHRLSSLSSIPETAGMIPRTRTQAKFTIDSNGRARVETTVFVEDDLPPPLSVRKRNQSQPTLRQHQQWHSSESDDDESSSDDEPIIIPSRNTSFVLPDPLKATRKNPLHGSQRSISERSTASYVTFGGQSYHDDPDSEAETVMNEMTPTGPGGGRSGDAASELKKLRESRQRGQQQQLPLPTKHKRHSYAGGGGAPVAEFVGGNSSYPRGHAVISPTSLTESSLPTPSSSRSQGIRCVCNRSEVDRDGDGFMVQCESCEMWLHGRCVNISKRTVPSVYICLFCANTPNMRGGRIRDNGRVSMGAMGGPMSSTASPLAHKSFKSFR